MRPSGALNPTGARAQVTVLPAGQQPTGQLLPDADRCARGDDDAGCFTVTGWAMNGEVRSRA